ncbi:MAG: hypothetical protein R6U32_06155 [Candidatus Woesearchaeota archaeon]
MKRDTEDKTEAEDKIIRALCLAGLAFFFVWGVITIAVRDNELIFDRFYSAAIMLAAYLFYRRMHLRLPALLLAFAVLFLHHLKLYGQTYYGFLQFDMIMHFAAGAALAVIFYQYLSYDHSRLWSAVMALLVAVGIGSLSEIMEYVGYYLLGPGEGLLFYGEGDFGEYADVAWDMMMNTAGAFAAAACSALSGVFILRGKKRQRKGKNKKG